MKDDENDVLNYCNTEGSLWRQEGVVNGLRVWVHRLPERMIGDVSMEYEQRVG